ncbi:MAG: glycoside hydrolase family protein [Candidatus Poribacteria bacterium]|nr:MAG: glycoside hydrolase family protein [Candidatus Poribacteria bacterium]
MAQGYVALVLHAHLPFVRHPEFPRFMEEDWLFEAITETYLPLLEVMEGLERDGVPFRLTMSLTPPLIAMLTDELLQKRYEAYLDARIELATNEMRRLRGSKEFYPLAEMYYGIFVRSRHRFTEQYGRNLVQAFRRFQDSGQLQILTCGATHGLLPLLQDRTIQRAQIHVAVEQYRRHFDRDPVGIWLPECAYVPGLDELLAEYGIRFFFLETIGILRADPPPVYGVYAPLYTPSGVAAFGRDPESSAQVWSKDSGYPGDYDYREFYRDIGFDLPLEYVGPYLHDRNVRHMLGIKYYRITGKTDEKATYHPGWARQKAELHAGNFLFNRTKQIEWLAQHMDRPPIVVAPYDAELFGHWWFEGPQFLDFFIRKVHREQDVVELITPAEYLDRHPVNQVAVPEISSWGANGTFEVWCNGTNDWIWPHLHQAGRRMKELAHRYPQAEGLLRRALNQAARELLLAQSSDWPFIMTMGTTVEYAVRRFRSHIARFTKLYEDIRNGEIDEPWLQEIERRDNIFPEIDYSIYRWTD